MRYFFFLFVSLLMTSTPNKTKYVSGTPFVVMQLFTSQGCSSCPAADKLAEKIKNEYRDKNVLMLSYHVTYWDRLGWKDPFGKRKYTEMQYAYADKFNERNVYTPQIVVNGKEHFIGSDEYILRKKLKQYLKKTSENSIQLVSAKKGGQLEVTYTVNGKIAGKKIVVALVLDTQITQVKRGENARRSLLNSNVVVNQQAHNLESSNGKLRLTIPKTNSKMRLIAFIQDSNLTISGGTQLAL